MTASVVRAWGPSDAVPTTRPSLATRLTLLFASSLTVMATVTIAPALPDISRHYALQDPDAFWVRSLVIAPAASIALMALPAGALVDRIGRRKPLIAACAIYAIAGSAGLWLEDLVALLVSRVLLGLSVAVLMMAATALIGDCFIGREREKFLGLQSAFMGFGGVVFLASGGLLVGWSWRAPFAIYLSGLAVSVLAIASLRGSIAERPFDAIDPRRTERAPPRAHPAPNLVIYGLAAVVFLTFYQVPTQLPFLLERLGLKPGALSGVVLATAALFGATAGLFYWVVKARLSFTRVMSMGFSQMAVGFVIVAMAPSWPVVWLGTAVAGTGWGLTMPNLNVWLLSGVAPARRGRAIGRLTCGVFLGQLASPLLAQPLVATVDVSAPFWAAAAVLVLLAIVLGKLRKEE